MPKNKNLKKPPPELTEKRKVSRGKKRPRDAMTRRKGGSRFTVETRTRVLTGLTEGLFRYTAAARAGICEKTLGNWIAKGRDELAAVDTWEQDLEAGVVEMGTCPPITDYGDFYLAVIEAEASTEAKHLQQIQTAGLEDWRASAWYLERRYNKRWGSGALRADLPSEEDFDSDDMADIEAMLLERVTTVETRIRRIKGDE